MERALMSYQSHNAPAVFRRVRLILIVAVLLLIGVKARTSYAINPVPVFDEPREALPASYEDSVVRPLSPAEEIPLLASADSDLPFPAFKLPIPSGAGHIPRDGGYNNGVLHLRGNYDQFALDICEGDSCSYGRHVVAPTDITYDFSTPSIGYHFFEVYDNGWDKLCMSLGHFNWPRSVFPSGLPEPGTSFPQGAVLGEVSWWGGMPHVHIGIWKMRSRTPQGYPTRCHEWTVPRYPQPFTGDYKLDGIDFEECWPETNRCYNVHSERRIDSSNAAFSYLEIERPPEVAGLFYEAPLPEKEGAITSPAKTGDGASL